MRTSIDVQGARENNLRDISLEIPRDKLVVVTGVSGSGKSSLAFDTVYAEGQRRLLASMSTFSKRFVGQLKKLDVEVTCLTCKGARYGQETLDVKYRGKSIADVLDLSIDGEVLACGTPEQIARCKASHTGRFLAAHL